MRDSEPCAEGMSEGVKSVLRQRNEKFSFIRGVVADVLRANPAVPYDKRIQTARFIEDVLLPHEGLTTLPEGLAETVAWLRS